MRLSLKRIVTPRVSVVLPVRNGARFLGEALASVQAQTLDEWELIVVDDGSSDDTLGIARTAARQDERIVVLSQPPGGIVRALNAGIAASSAEFIARMDADDVAKPERLAQQLAFLEHDPACVAVGSAIEIIDEDGEVIGQRAYPQEHDAILHALLHDRGSLVHPTVMMRKSAFDAAGRYRLDTDPSEDLDLWLRLSDIGRLANVPEALLEYRRHREAVSARERGRQRAMTAAILDDAHRRHGIARRERRTAFADENAAVTYHYDCARIALACGNIANARKHARASVAAQRFRLSAYIALAACFLPRRILGFFARAYAMLRHARSA